jgi:hypothetical protein
MKNKSLNLAASVLLSILVVSGCSSTSGSEEKPKASSDDLSIELIEKNYKEDEFTKNYPEYQVSFDDEPGMESISITNHDPNDILHLPNYQELIQYGYISLESDEIVYAIDIFIDDTGSYYSAEYNAKTKELLTEDGDWKPDGDLAEFVEERLAMMDSVLQ